MTKETSIKLFEEKKVRTAWDEKTEEWYFSVVDVVGILTDSPDPKRYWSVLKTRLKQEGVEGTTICSTLKLLVAELSTKEISEVSNPETMDEHEDIAQRGANIAREARMKLEAETGKKVVSPLNAKNVLSIGNENYN